MADVSATKVIFAFFTGLVIIYITARLIGEANKAKWFRKRQQMSFFNMRGALGDTFHFGYPCTWQGGLIVTLMYSVIFIVGYIIVFIA